MIEGLKIVRESSKGIAVQLNVDRGYHLLATAEEQYIASAGVIMRLRDGLARMLLCFAKFRYGKEASTY